MLSRSSSLLRPPPTSARHFTVSQGRWLSVSMLPGTTGWRLVVFSVPGVETDLSSSRTPFWPFHAPCAGRFFGTRSKFSGAVHGLRPLGRGSAPPRPCGTRTGVTTLQASLDVADWSVARPRFAPSISAAHGGFATGDLGVSRAGLTPAGCPQLVDWLRHHNVNLLVVMAPNLLDALPIRRESVTTAQRHTWN